MVVTDLLLGIVFAFGFGVAFATGFEAVFGGLQTDSIQRWMASADFGIAANCAAVGQDVTFVVVLVADVLAVGFGVDVVVFLVDFFVVVEVVVVEVEVSGVEL